LGDRQLRHLVEIEVHVLQLESQGKQLEEDERYLSDEHVVHPVVPADLQVTQLLSQFWQTPAASLYLVEGQYSTHKELSKT
jgi:hypothetical protein